MVELSSEARVALINLEALAPTLGKFRVSQRHVDNFNDDVNTLAEEVPEVGRWKIGRDLMIQPTTPVRTSIGGTRIAGGEPRGEPWLQTAEMESRVNAVIRCVREEAGRPRSDGAAAVLGERKRLLATLVEAYLKEPVAFYWWPNNVMRKLRHPGFPDGAIEPNWSHVEALVAEGLLVKSDEGRAGGKVYTIPDAVLAPAARATRSGAQPRNAAISTIVVNVNGDANNLAIGNDGVSQSAASAGLTAEALATMLDELRRLGITDDQIEGFAAAVAEDMASNDPSTADALGGWLNNFTAGLSANLAGGSVFAIATNLSKVSTVVGEVARMLGG